MFEQLATCWKVFQTTKVAKNYQEKSHTRGKHETVGCLNWTKIVTRSIGIFLQRLIWSLFKFFKKFLVDWISQFMIPFFSHSNKNPTIFESTANFNRKKSFIFIYLWAQSETFTLWSSSSSSDYQFDFMRTFFIATNKLFSLLNIAKMALIVCDKSLNNIILWFNSLRLFFIHQGQIGRACQGI